MAADAAALLGRIEGQVLAAMAVAAEVVETPGFRLYLGQPEEPFYRTLAVPTARPDESGANAWAPAIRAMCGGFAAVGRQPRLEFVEERWPDLPAALLAAGFTDEARLPLMATTAEDWKASGPGPAQAAAARLAGSNEAGLLAAYLGAVNASFGPGLAPAALALEVSRLQAEIAAGQCLLALVDDAAGAILAGASLIGIGASATAELAGVWTAPASRRRGLGKAVCRYLVGHFFAAGGRLVWLGADGVAAECLYAAAGFRRIGWQRNFSLCGR